MELDLANPLLVIGGGILFLAMLYFWNKRNTVRQRERRKRDFRSGYYQRKKSRKEEMKR